MKKIILPLLFMLPTVIFAQEKTVQDSTKTKKLNDVTVYGNQKQFLKIESDKKTVSVKDNPMLNTGNAYEAVKKIPGVISSPIGSLTLNGKGVMIYIDGAPSTLTGTDLQNYLSSLPASAIEKVELIYNPGAAFDANSSGSIINIITNSKRLKGVNANFNINYNFNKYQKPSPQILFNGKEKYFSWQTMLGYNYIDSEERSINGQTFTGFNPSKFINQDRLTVNTERNGYFRIGTNFKLSKKSNLLFNYNGNWANNRSVFDLKTTGTGISDYSINGISKDKNNNNEISLQYKTKLDTIGRTLDIIAFFNSFDKNPITQNTDLYNSTINLRLKNSYLKYDFNFPFEKQKFSINIGGKFNNLRVSDDGSYTANSTRKPDINFDYSEDNLAFYIEARKKIKKFNFTTGLRFEDFNVSRIASTSTEKVVYKSTNLFPNISAMYEINKDINVSTSYSRKISQPNYNEIDPNNSANFDQYNTSAGNPFLKPTFFDNFDFKINAYQFIEIGANYIVAKDQNMFIYNAEPGQMIINQTFQQFDKFKTLTAFLNFPLPLDYFLHGKEEFEKRMSNMDKMNYIYFSITYIKSITDGYSFSFENKPIWSYAAESQIILPQGIKGNLSYFILPTGNWQIYRVTKPIQEFSVSLSKDFLNKKLKIGVHVFDVFNANEVNAIVSSTNLETNFYKKNDSRNFRLSLSYNFGNLKLEKENTEIETEKIKKGGGMMK